MYINKPKIAPKPVTASKEESKDPVSVFCRVRPPPYEFSLEQRCVQPQITGTLGTVKLIPPDNSFAYRNGQAKELLYKFQGVFDENSQQKEVFDTVAKPLVQDLLNGRNGLLFTYGITGSGKTYTMEGRKQDGGLLQRSVDVIFNSIKGYQSRRNVFKPDKMNGYDAQSISDAELIVADKFHKKQKILKNDRRIYTRAQRNNGENTSLERIPDQSIVNYIDEDNVYAVFVNYIEIYNKYVYDLLEDFSENDMTNKLQSKLIRNDPKGNMYIHGGIEVEVQSAEEALEILHRGQKQRKVAYTRLNCESSRSHSIFTIRVVQAPLDAQGEEVVLDKSAITISQFSLVDLAGSERTNRTKASGNRVKESGNINNSLMVLRQCIQTLRENQMFNRNKIVSYRSDQLTKYLGNYFDGNGAIKMVVCVSPRPDDFDETLPVMQFAELAAEVTIHRTLPSTRPEFGFTPGRRRACLAMKEAKKRVQEEGHTVVEADLVDLTPVYALSSDWPKFSSDPAEFENTVVNLQIFLKNRISHKEKFIKEIKSESGNLIKNVAVLEKESIEMRMESRSLRALYDDAAKNNKEMQKKLMNVEVTNDQLQMKLSDFNGLWEKCKQACEERDMAKSQAHFDKQRMKAKWKQKMVEEREKIHEKIEKLAKQMQFDLVQQKDELKSQMFETQVKALQTMFDTPGRSRFGDQLKLPRKCPTPVKTSKSDPKLNESIAKQEGSAMGKRHRRSLSQGDNVWVDHQPSKVVETGTVLQPNMQYKRSVRRLKSSDLLSDKKVNHYCLTTQNQDSSGDMETKLYKGDVLPTVGGGVQVEFHDVEILRQKDPLNVRLRKRSSDGTPKVNQETLRNRCAVGLQGLTPGSNQMYKRHRK